MNRHSLLKDTGADRGGNPGFLDAFGRDELIRRHFCQFVILLLTNGMKNITVLAIAVIHDNEMIYFIKRRCI